jgi:hypothetical protein
MPWQLADLSQSMLLILTRAHVLLCKQAGSQCSIGNHLRGFKCGRGSVSSLVGIQHGILMIGHHCVDQAA